MLTKKKVAFWICWGSGKKNETNRKHTLKGVKSYLQRGSFGLICIKNNEKRMRQEVFLLPSADIFLIIQKRRKQKENKMG